MKSCTIERNERGAGGWVVLYETRSGKKGETWCRTLDEAEQRRTELLSLAACGLIRQAFGFDTPKKGVHRMRVEKWNEIETKYEQIAVDAVPSEWLRELEWWLAQEGDGVEIEFPDTRGDRHLYRVSAATKEEM